MINVISLTEKQVLAIAELTKRHSSQRANISKTDGVAMVRVEFMFPYGYLVDEDGTVTPVST